MEKLIVLILVGMLVLSACGGAGGDIEAHEPWVRSALQGSNDAVYMIVHNHSNVDDAIVGVSSDAAEAVEIHRSAMDANGVMTMAQQESITLPADEEVVFKPGGYHVMMVNLKRDLNPGDEIIVTVHFQNHEDIILKVPVMDMEGDMDMNHSE